MQMRRINLKTGKLFSTFLSAGNVDIMTLFTMFHNNESF
jgi:hypothetical protein